MNKTLKYSLLTLVAAMGMVACQDTYEYEAGSAGETSAAQVFFPETQLNDSIIALERKADEAPADKVYSFDIAIQRRDSANALTVALENRQDPTSTSQLNVPTEVTFEEGVGTAYITVTYDPTSMSFDDFNRDTLFIADPTIASQYGGSEFRFKACIPAPYVDYEIVERKDGQTDEEYQKEWDKKNLATYRDGIFCGMYGGAWGNPNEYQLIFQKHMVEEGVYRLVNPFGARYVNTVLKLSGDDAYKEEDFDTHYMVIHIVDDENDPEKNYVWIEPASSMLVLDDEDGELLYTSYIAYYMENGYDFDFLIERVPDLFGTLKNGVITMPKNSMLIGFSVYTGGAFKYYGNGKGTFAIALPGYPLEIPDYSVTAEYVGMLTLEDDSREAAVKITLGENVATAKYLLTTADESEEDVALRIKGDADHDPDESAIEITATSRVYLPMEEDGDYRVTVVTFDEEGNAQETTSCTFEFTKEVAWEDLGIGLWTDDFMAPYGVTDNYQFEVEILASLKTPGLYRVENPYGEFGLEVVNKWIEINAEDPTHVYVPYNDLFVDSDGDRMGIESIASSLMGQGAPISWIDENYPGYFGTLEDGVFSFPTAKSFYISRNDEPKAYGNPNSAFEVVLPEAYESEVKALRAPGKKISGTKIQGNRRKGISKLQYTAPWTKGRFGKMLSKNFQKVDKKDIMARLRK